MKRFDPLHSIQKQTVLLEASAGTGKTYSIAGKVVRLVAQEGIDIDAILIVTFTRAATAELKDRIRSILVDARDAIAGVTEAEHGVIQALAEEAQKDDATRERYLKRLKRSIARFDMASIYTIHGFCERALALAAFDIGADPSAELQANVMSASERASDDLYIEALARDDRERGEGEKSLRKAKSFTHDKLRSIAQTRWNARGARIADPGEENVATEAVKRFTEEIVPRIERELEKRRSISFDQLIHDLKDALENETTRHGLVSALRARYQAALIDEFQDTDEAQWAIFNAIFGEGAKIFELVGDPKQAIYSFRGADIEVYKRARNEADQRFTLDVNYRSSPEYIEAMNILFGAGPGLNLDESGIEESHPFATDDIPYLKVGANLKAKRPRLVLHDGRALTPLRILRGGDIGSGGVGDARAWSNRLVVDEILHLLEHAEFRDDEKSWPVVPSDIVVLVRTKARGAEIAKLLREKGVRCVSPKESPLFKSEAATIVENLLELSLNPTDRRLLRSLAFGPLFSLRRSEFDEDEERRLEFQVASIAEAFNTDLGELGVGPSVLRLISTSFEHKEGVPELLLEALLKRENGERLVTDLRHLSETLHLEAVDGHLSASAILKLLQERRSQGGAGEEDEEYAVRLESDADALTIMTIHVSKGLEFPIVFLPELDGVVKKYNRSDVIVFPDEGVRTIDPFRGEEGKANATRERHQVLAQTASFEESLRLLYVAFTRARYHAVAFFHPVFRRNKGRKLIWHDVPISPLAHIVYGKNGESPKSVIVNAINAGNLEPIDEIGHDLAQRSIVNGEARIEYRVVEALEDRPRYQSKHSAEALSKPASYGGPRTFYSFFGRHSYSQVVRYGRDDKSLALLGSIGEHGGSDEGHPVESEPVSEGALPLANFPKGTRPGTFVHLLLEELDFRTGRPKDESRSLEDLLKRAAAKAGFFGERQDAFRLIEGALPGILRTPLGGSLGALSLSDLHEEDRLDELNFVMPIARRTFAQKPRVDVRALPDIFGRGVSVPLEYEIEGFMNGSIDLVFRAPDSEGQLRYYLADYKSNALGGAAAFHPTRLRDAMDAHEYWVQAAFYLLALDSYLAHRIENYDYERDFGGVYYLFLRGMTGEDALLEDGGVRGVLALRPKLDEMERLRRWLEEGEDKMKSKTKASAKR